VKNSLPIVYKKIPGNLISVHAEAFILGSQYSYGMASGLFQEDTM
jgi:hypothetical protein